MAVVRRLADLLAIKFSKIPYNFESVGNFLKKFPKNGKSFTSGPPRIGIPPIGSVKP